MDLMGNKILATLKETRYACTSLSLVSGGNANFTYRGTLLLPLIDGIRSSETIVIKHAEPYIAVNPDWELDVGRSKFESTMLESLHSMAKNENPLTFVTTPKLYQCDEETHTQIVTDFNNSINMKAYLIKYGTRSTGDSFKIKQSPQAERLGKALGEWSHAFHRWAEAPEQAKLTATMRENPIAAAKHHYTYGSLVDTIAMFPDILGVCEDMFHDLDVRNRDELESGAGQLIHGDFWTGNILLHDSPLPPSAKPVTIMVVDWEVASIGPRAYDLGQLFAELYLLTYLRRVEEGAAMIESFMEGYGPIDKATGFRAAIHFGMHFLAWTCKIPNWSDEINDPGKDKEIMDRLVKFGRDTMEAAYKEDLEHFRESVLYPLFFPRKATA